MANYIGCRSCIEPDCTGCNMLVLEKALKQGRFDGLKDAGHTIRILGDVVEVRHGRWLESNNGPLQKCSVCGATGWDEFYYCPNCGAKMKGAGEDA